MTYDMLPIVSNLEKLILQMLCKENVSMFTWWLLSNKSGGSACVYHLPFRKNVLDLLMLYYGGRSICWCFYLLKACVCDLKLKKWEEDIFVLIYHVLCWSMCIDASLTISCQLCIPSSLKIKNPKLVDDTFVCIYIY